MSGVRSTHKKQTRRRPASSDLLEPINRLKILYRPARFKYVKKLVRIKDCVFCTAARAKISSQSLCLFKTDFSQIIVNKFPYNSGHLLVLPRSHKADLLDLNADEFQDLHETLRLATQALREIYKPSGLNVGLNLGAAAGAGLPDHLHYHIIPRWEGDLNFFPLIAATKVVIETPDQTWSKLVAWFRTYGGQLK